VVTRSKEWHRINQLPRRDLDDSEVFPGLWSVQNMALNDLRDQGNLVACIPVGGGKTLISALAPVVLGSKKPCLAVPANLITKTQREFAKLRETYPIPEINVLSHARVSLSGIPEGTDCMIIDEAHRYGNYKSARTQRLTQWRKDNLDAAMVVLSGSFMDGSIGPLCKISGLALTEGSPLPYPWFDVQQWSASLDADVKIRFPPGALLEWGGPDLEAVRSGFLERCSATPGFYVSDVKPFDGPLEYQWVQGPKVCSGVIKDLTEFWTDHTGADLESAALVADRVRQAEIGCGYRLDPAPDPEWLEARTEWNQFVRSKLNSKLLSPGMVHAAYPEEHEAWVKIKNTYRGTELVDWLDMSVIRWAEDWAIETGGVVWIGHVRDVPSRIPFFGAGDDGILDHEGPCFASIRAHGVGKTLTQFSDMLVLTAPSSGSIWEQLVGRLHRFGQTKQVTVSIRDSPMNRKGLRKAKQKSKFTERGYSKLEKMI
jgi:hypothetical protein